MKATLTCPFCGGKQEVEVPEDRCLAFHKCEKCGRRISAKNECCAICEYTDRKCPMHSGK